MEENQPKKQGPYPRLTGGLILILLGALFLLTEMDRISWGDWWAYFLVGLGGIFILEAIIRAFSAEGRRGMAGRLIAGCILSIIGGSHLLGFEEWWPLVLIVVGVVILFSSFLEKR
ncbi:MAG: hypothetical protein AB1715_08360 [Acidobacteriota bacterium]